MRIGIVCPYSFAVAGGVQNHVRELAQTLLAAGHDVSVLTPAGIGDSDLPEFVRPAGRGLAVRFNGSVARLRFDPVAYMRVKQWLRAGCFDVLHLHEPTVPSLSMLAAALAGGPIVATFHLSTPRSRVLAACTPLLRPLLEKITARIAVSSAARRVQVEHLGGDAVEIPNGLHTEFFATAAPLLDCPVDGPTIGFVGRFTEPRKGMGVLLAALREMLPYFPRLRLLVIGAGRAELLWRAAGPTLSRHIELLGPADDTTKARLLRSVDVYCAPNTGGESFGMVLAEAMAAGAPVVASELDSFRRVLAEGRSGVLTPVGDSTSLARTLGALLRDPQRRTALARAGRRRVASFDWECVVAQVLRVYETAMAADPRRLDVASWDQSA